MPTIEEIKAHLEPQGIEVLEFSQPTPTAATAATAVGCALAQIAKTILLIVGGEPVVVVTCGDMKVNSSLLKRAAARSGKVRFPDPAEVIEKTGYAPGGVCPFLLPPQLLVFLDASLRRFAVTYPAAGNNRSAAALTFEQLQSLTGGRQVAVCQPLAQ